MAKGMRAMFRIVQEMFEANSPGAKDGRLSADRHAEEGGDAATLAESDVAEVPAPPPKVIPPGPTDESPDAPALPDTPQPTPPDQPGPVQRVLQSIRISPPNPFIPVGAWKQLTAWGHYNEGPDKILLNLVWTSTAPDIVKAHPSGLVCGQPAGGLAKITATDPVSKLSGFAFVTVMPDAPKPADEEPDEPQLDKPVPESLMIIPPAIVMGSSPVQFNAMGKYSDGSFRDVPVMWISLAPHIVVIGGDGVARPSAMPGTGLINAIDKITGRVASATITVMGNAQSKPADEASPDGPSPEESQ